MKRPELAPHISVADFRGFYWLREELLGFCRRNGLPTGGSKAEIGVRIERFLAAGGAPATVADTKRRSRGGKLPGRLSLDTLIGPNWRCSEHLRAFLVREIGPQFHFNGAMRDFIKDGEGRTLQDVIDAWHADRSSPKAETDIAPQFEYNRHVREFFKANPGGTLQDAIAAWNERKSRRKNRPDE